MRKRISSNTSVIEVHQIIPCETGGQHNLVSLVALDGFHLNMLQNGIGLEKYTKLIGEGLHGNHPAYDKYVKNAIR